jgi:hypothetical protein
MRAREGAAVHSAAAKSKVPAKFSSRDNQDGTGGIRRDGDCFRSRTTRRSGRSEMPLELRQRQ